MKEIELCRHQKPLSLPDHHLNPSLLTKVTTILAFTMRNILSFITSTYVTSLIIHYFH